MHVLKFLPSIIRQKIINNNKKGKDIFAAGQQLITLRSASSSSSPLLLPQCITYQQDHSAHLPSFHPFFLSRSHTAGISSYLAPVGACLNLMLRVLLVTVDFTSHLRWSRGLRRALQSQGHACELIALPGTEWKWRLHCDGAVIGQEAKTLAEEVRRNQGTHSRGEGGAAWFDVVLVDAGVVDVATVVATLRQVELTMSREEEAKVRQERIDAALRAPAIRKPCCRPPPPPPPPPPSSSSPTPTLPPPPRATICAYFHENQLTFPWQPRKQQQQQRSNHHPSSREVTTEFKENGSSTIRSKDRDPSKHTRRGKKKEEEEEEEQGRRGAQSY